MTHPILTPAVARARHHDLMRELKRAPLRFDAAIRRQERRARRQEALRRRFLIRLRRSAAPAEVTVAAEPCEG
jgi:hypothetical protein